MATLTRGIPLSKISPKFLHSNSTSHTWPFSAVAELIDNAYDPDVSAKEVRIDKCVIHGKPCLVIGDDGAGMDFDHLLRMLSFGYCEKDAFENSASHLPIGHYGNGFKSGSMRLGKDAVVFTVCKKSASVGFLSQTYLEAIRADCVFVPMIEYRLPHFERFKSQESRNNLEAMLKYSPFHNEQELKAELQQIYRNRTSTGTKIVLYNLKRHRNGKLELDFESDNTDIRNPEAHEVDLTSVYHRTSAVESSEYMRSLRVYCSILFLHPRMKIYIRNQKVKTQLITKSLSNTEIDCYKPTWLSKPLRITFGFSTKAQLKEDYGVMFYHRNRLIKAYEKLGYQKQPNDLGIGVVGVVQVDFLKPIHNKQDFEKDEKYNATMSAIGLKLNEYWNEKRNGQAGPANPTPTQLPDWLWVQCERCLKWRRLPDQVRRFKLPDQWFCHMNPDPTHNRCDIPEEPEDEDEAVQRPTYQKTYKKKQEEQKRQKQALIAQKERELQAREAALLEAQRRQMQQLNEVSSSQSRQGHRDIAKLQKELLEAKKREEDQKRLIVRIQTQKRQLEVQQTSLASAAHSLRSATTSSSELLEVASALADDRCSPVSSTSVNGRKRHASNSSAGSSRKVMNITTDQGDMFTIERADDSDDDGDNDAYDPPETMEDDDDDRTYANENDTALPPLDASTSPPPKKTTSTSTSAPNRPTTRPGPACSKNKRKKNAPETVVDLTLDDDNEGSIFTTTLEDQQDVKPNVAELDRQMQEETDRQEERAEKDRQGGSSNEQQLHHDEPSDCTCPESAADMSSAAENAPSTSSAADNTPSTSNAAENAPSTSSTADNAPSSKKGKKGKNKNKETFEVHIKEEPAEQGTSRGGDGRKKVREEETRGGVGGEKDAEEGTSAAGEEKDGEEGDTKLGRLRHKYTLLLQRFRNLQCNTHKLLSFIVPDVDLGSVDDIEHIVSEMIRVNCDAKTGKSDIPPPQDPDNEPPENRRQIQRKPAEHSKDDEDSVETTESDNITGAETSAQNRSEPVSRQSSCEQSDLSDHKLPGIERRRSSVQQSEESQDAAGVSYEATKDATGESEESTAKLQDNVKEELHDGAGEHLQDDRETSQDSADDSQDATGKLQDVEDTSQDMADVSQDATENLQDTAENSQEAITDAEGQLHVHNESETSQDTSENVENASESAEKAAENLENETEQDASDNGENASENAQQKATENAENETEPEDFTRENLQNETEQPEDFTEGQNVPDETGQLGDEMETSHQEEEEASKEIAGKSPSPEKERTEDDDEIAPDLLQQNPDIPDLTEGQTLAGEDLEETELGLEETSNGPNGRDSVGPNGPDSVGPNGPNSVEPHLKRQASVESDSAGPTAAKRRDSARVNSMESDSLGPDSMLIPLSQSQSLSQSLSYPDVIQRDDVEQEEAETTKSTERTEPSDLQQPAVSKSKPLGESEHERETEQMEEEGEGGEPFGDGENYEGGDHYKDGDNHDGDNYEDKENYKAGDNYQTGDNYEEPEEIDEAGEVDSRRTNLEMGDAEYQEDAMPEEADEGSFDSRPVKPEPADHNQAEEEAEQMNLAEQADPEEAEWNAENSEPHFASDEETTADHAGSSHSRLLAKVEPTDEEFDQMDYEQEPGQEPDEMEMEPDQVEPDQELDQVEPDHMEPEEHAEDTAGSPDPEMQDDRFQTEDIPASDASPQPRAAKLEPIDLDLEYPDEEENDELPDIPPTPKLEPVL